MSSRIQSAPVKTRNAGTRISVVVRVRPPNEREIASAQGNVIHVLDDRVLIFDPPGERVQKTKFIQSSQARAKNLHFGFDKVLSPDNTQEDVFDVVKNSIFSKEGGLLDGFNCTVFAYGATGSGKTFSMAGTPENPGLMSRAVQYIYTALEGMGRKAKLKLSYLEIYNEQIRDLIAPDDNSKNLKIVEDPEKGIIVTGLSHCYPTNTDEVLQLISIGNNRRTQAQTESNPVSSRSHAVCQIEVENYDIADIQSNNSIGKLSLIDLAGSERATSNTGIRLKESAKINCSLLALSNCINALCTQNSFIPFRQSKLTRLLKDSLGGNCKTVCLSCVSPSYLTYDDTYSTLQYANKTKNIRTNVSRNTLNVKAQVSQYPKIIAELKAEIQQLKSNAGGNSLAESFAKSIDESFNKEKQSILAIFNHEMQNIIGTDIKQQLMAIQKMANSDIKRKVSLKLSSFKTECIQKKPKQSNRIIDNEQKVRMLELENIILKGQLDLAEKQISIQQNVIRSISSKQSQIQIQSQSLIQPKQLQLQMQPQISQVQTPIQKPPQYQIQSQQLLQPQAQTPIQPPPQMASMPLLDLSQAPTIAAKSDNTIDLIDLTEESKETRTENVDPNKANNTLYSFFDEPETSSLKTYNSNQTKEFCSQPYQQQNQLQNQQQLLPYQRTPLNLNAQQQPLSARRQLENRVSITDMSRIKNVHINSNSNTNSNNNSIINNNINNNNNNNINNTINTNGSTNYNITSCTGNNINTNSPANSFTNSYSDINNSNQTVSRIVRHDDPGRIFRQKFAEAEKIDSARKPLSEKSGNGSVSSGMAKYGGSYKSLIDQLSERVAANGMKYNDETTSILLRSRMLTQVGKR